MKNSRQIWFIAVNNLRQFLTDRLAVIMFILFPFLFIIMFNILLGNLDSGDQRLEMHLATQENSGLSQQIIQSMVTADPGKLAPGDPVIVWDKDYNQARADVEAGKLNGLLAFPADFTQYITAGKNSHLEIIVRSEDTETRAALNGLAQSISSRIGAHLIEINSVVALMVQQGKNTAEIQEALSPIIQRLSTTSNTQSLITYQVDSVGEAKPVNASSYVVPGYLVMFVFFAAAISAIDIIRERRNHTLERLIASSVKKESILGGIYLGGLLRGLVQIAIFWTAGILIFQVDLGASPWAVILLSVLIVLMSAAFSMMLATIVKTERSASALAVLCSLLLAPLGGCWWPLFIEPQWMQFLAKFTPHGWANLGLDKLLVFGACGGDVLWEMLALAGFSIAFLIIAILNFRTGADVT